MPIRRYGVPSEKKTIYIRVGLYAQQLIMEKREELNRLLFEIRQTLNLYGERHRPLIKKIDALLPVRTAQQAHHDDPEESINFSDNPTEEDLKQDKPLKPEIQKSIIEKEVKKMKAEQSQICSGLNTASCLEQPHKQQLLYKPEINIQLYILDYDSESKFYHPIRTNDSNTGAFKKQMADLLLSTPRIHLKRYANFSQIRKYVSQPPKIHKTLVVPLVDGDRFALVFQSFEWRIHEHEYERSDRFYIFITDRFMPYTAIAMVKAIVKEQFEDKLRIGKSKYQLNYSLVKLKNRKNILDRMEEIISNTDIYSLSIDRILKNEQELQLSKFVQNITTYNILVRIHSLHYISLPLLTLAVFFAIRQYKIILVSQKENRHLMSELMMGIKAALSPIEYQYPTIFSCVVQRHLTYLEAPLPCLIGYWSDKIGCNKVSKIVGDLHKIDDNSKVPCVLINLDEMSVKHPVMLDEQESKQAIYLQQFTKDNDYITANQANSSKQTFSLVQRLNFYIFDQLVNNPTKKTMKDSEKFKESFNYQIYKQKKEQQLSTIQI